MMFVIIMFIKILLIILISIIGILIIILIIPYTYSITYNVSNDIIGTVSIKILAGLLKFQNEKLESKSSIKVYFFSLQVYCKDYGEKERESVEKKVAFKVKKKVNLKGIGLEFLKRIARYLYEVGNLIKPKTFVICGTYGFDDPLVTGVISSLVPIVKTIVTSVDIYLNPVFLDKTINIDVKCEGKLSLFVIGFKTLMFIFDKNVSKLLKNN